MITPKYTILATSLLAATPAALYADLVRLPHLFPYSDVAIPALMAGGLAIAINMMLPDRAFYTPEQILRHAFKQRHEISNDRAEVVLEAINDIRKRNNRLEKSKANLAEKVQAEVSETEKALEEVAKVLFYDPSKLPQYQATLVRSESVVEAVELQSKIRKSKASEEEIASSRERTVVALESLQEALNKKERDRAQALLSQVEVVSEVAETLLKPQKKVA